MSNLEQAISEKNWQNILLSRQAEGVYLLTVNRPKVLNALNAETLDELGEALDAVAQATDIRVLLLTGAGEKSFVAGADIAQMSKLSALEGKYFSEKGMAVFRKLENLPVPAIALVNGFALGGGCELAMSCDFILASDNARFGQPEVNLGVSPGFGGSQRLTRIVGRPMAMELLCSGRMVKADEAKQLGLANHVYPQAELLDEGIKLATLIASKSRSAVQLTKQLVQRGQDMDLENACVMESDVFGLCFATEDKAEGMAAFLEGRAPEFK